MAGPQINEVRTGRYSARWAAGGVHNPGASRLLQVCRPAGGSSQSGMAREALASEAQGCSHYMYLWRLVIGLEPAPFTVADSTAEMRVH